ncbi:MAG: serine hydrolase domain-containing protein [Pirellulales bacterium]
MKHEEASSSRRRDFLKSLLAAGAVPWVAPHCALAAEGQTQVSIADGKWRLNGQPTYPGTPAAGLLMNVRVVNATFEDARRPEFNPDANTDAFLAQVPDYARHGVRAFTLCLQGGMPGYEGAVNSAFEPDGSLRAAYLKRVRRVIDACDRQGLAVILGCYYQRQSKLLKDAAAVRAGLVNVVNWIRESRLTNVVLETANEYPHDGFAHAILRTPEGQAELLRLAKKTWPQLLVSASGYGDGKLHDAVAEASDFLLIHFNGTPVEEIPARIAALRKFNKSIVCNEDDKTGLVAARAAQACVENVASWGLMLKDVNQYTPFRFGGAADDPVVYAKLQELTSPAASARKDSRQGYFPPPESKGGWQTLDRPEEIRRLAGMDPEKLAQLKTWLLESDTRDFAAVVVRRGYVVLEVERNKSSREATENVKSCAKAICATVLAIASEQSRRGRTPKKMTFDDPAFNYIPWAYPLSDPRKAKITVKQLLNHTSGLAPEATGARNSGPWEYVLGHSGDPITAKLAFDPGTDLGYSTQALYHAALVCENVTGKPYDEFAVENLFRPLGIEKWWFEFFTGGEKYGRHPSHALGLPARAMARIAYCMLRGGQWDGRQVIPRWFIDETSGPTHAIHGSKSFDREAESFSHGWELPGLLKDPRGQGLPRDARSKPGSGGQLISFVPSLDLVISRQTGSSGEWGYEEYLRLASRACGPERG